jgi:hypothetical protein
MMLGDGWSINQMEMPPKFGGASTDFPNHCAAISSEHEGSILGPFALMEIVTRQNGDEKWSSVAYHPGNSGGTRVFANVPFFYAQH